MKKSAIALIAVSVLVLAAATSFRPSTRAEGPKSIPDSVFAVFDKSCINCHSNDGSGMAKGKLNFDKWDSYSGEKMVSKARDISKELEKGAMPPSNFRKNNPDLVPTEADVAIVKAWAGSLKP